jgi:hypothetical protein
MSTTLNRLQREYDTLRDCWREVEAVSYGFPQTLRADVLQAWDILAKVDITDGSSVEFIRKGFDERGRYIALRVSITGLEHGRILLHILRNGSTHDGRFVKGDALGGFDILTVVPIPNTSTYNLIQHGRVSGTFTGEEVYRLLANEGWDLSSFLTFPSEGV